MRNNIFTLFGKSLIRYASFKGRAGRKEFWSFILVSFFIWSLLLFFLVDLEIKEEVTFGEIFAFFLYPLTMLPPFLSVWIRRIHDVGLPAYYIFIPFYNILLLFIRGQQGSNQFGGESSQKNVYTTSLNKEITRKEINTRSDSTASTIFSSMESVGALIFTVATIMHEASEMKWLVWEELQNIIRYLWLLGGGSLLLSRLFLYWSKYKKRDL